MDNVCPESSTGEYIKPQHWNNFINNENVVLIDTRNAYESEIGYFEKSVFPLTKNFSEFPNWIKKNENFFKNKKIAMYCTGGIRCEKASSFLISKGYKNIFQLEGGILNYIEHIEKKRSKWKGECFVFDERISVNHSLEKGMYEQCFACRSALSKEDIKSSFYIKGVSCPKCYLTTTKKQKNDRFYKGVFLIKRLRHDFDFTVAKHTTYLTLVKDSLEETLDGPEDNFEPKPKKSGRLIEDREDFYPDI